MVTFTATWLGRDDTGQYTREHEYIPAESVRDVMSFIRHGERNGKWAVEGDIHVRCQRLEIDTWVKA